MGLELGSHGINLWIMWDSLVSPEIRAWVT